ncbi:patatin-like phospholipase family protein [Tunturiibacter gelidiferens]|uniref:patatin-like phospholipase family protein n=1 Tax=Tunturiibacter gelidiferens TaxID=3069689 RepID=UPI003D9B53E7
MRGFRQGVSLLKIAFCRWIFAAIAIAAIFAGATEAQKPVVEPPTRPRIGLVLEGGGALGFAHIGVIEWMEDHHIPVDDVAGTSMGGLIGGLYASGNSPRRLGHLLAESTGRRC